MIKRKKMFKPLFLIIALVFFAPQFSFSQDGQYVAFNKEFTTVEQMASAGLLVVNLASETKVTGTYYEWKNNNWEATGNFTAERTKNSFKGEGVEGTFNGDNVTVGSYNGFLIPYVAGTYFVNGNKNKIVKITQDGPFLDVTNENNETSKGVIVSETMFLMTAWDRIGIVGDKGQISVKDGVDWIKE
ncbi:MAG TPA: hypothetical protein VHP32_01130 [Ignavibacteria bacterium]|nr:hypothetical protein [Ignavibacteria bacterium]